MFNDKKYPGLSQLKDKDFDMDAMHEDYLEGLMEYIGWGVKLNIILP